MLTLDIELSGCAVEALGPQDVAPGSTLEQKFVAGLRDYPDPGTWWIGLLLLAPETRGRGLGRGLERAFVDHVGANHGLAVMLGVVEDNHRDRRDHAGDLVAPPRSPRGREDAVRAWLSRHAGDRLR